MRGLPPFSRHFHPAFHHQKDLISDNWLEKMIRSPEEAYHKWCRLWYLENEAKNGCSFLTTGPDPCTITRYDQVYINTYTPLTHRTIPHFLPPFGVM